MLENARHECVTTFPPQREGKVTIKRLTTNVGESRHDHPEPVIIPCVIDFPLNFLAYEVTWTYNKGVVPRQRTEAFRDRQPLEYEPWSPLC